MESTSVNGGVARGTVVALVCCQVGLHGCLNGVRMSAPLQALGQGVSASWLGVLMALFAFFPALLAIPAGRFADRRGYHFPVYIALSLAFVGAALAAISDQLWVLFVSAALVGSGSSLGMIALQRTAGRLATNPSERLRIFSWIALAPSIANFAGPMLAGMMIDHVGFRTAFASLALLPLLTLFAVWWVPHEVIARPEKQVVATAKGWAWDLLLIPDFRRLLFINWLIAATWDAHSFALPILGHERSLSASAIGMVLGAYALTSAGVRLLIPVFAERLSPRWMMCLALGLTAGMFAIYPLLHSAWAMAACAGILGLGLGVIQPSVMSTIHQVTPTGRQGEALGLRSSFVHLSTLVMPLGFGALGAALGVGPVFWVMGLALSAGSWKAWNLGAHPPTARETKAS